MQSFPCKNHYECYKKLAAKTWPVLSTFTYISLYIHSSSAGKQKVVVIADFLSILDHRPLQNYIYITRLLQCECWLQYQQTPHTTYSIHHVSIIIVLLRVKRSMCFFVFFFNFQMSKFTLQLNQPYQCSQFSQTMSSKLQISIQNPVKHLRWSV